MTAVCGGGSSETKPGVSSTVYVDQTLVQSLLPPALAWLYPYLPFMQGLAIGDVDSFCSSDPPNVLTVPDPADFLAFITGGSISAYLDVNAFLQSITKAYLWYALCRCSSGSATPITPPSDPGDLPTINPPFIPPPTGGGVCLDMVSPRYEIVHFNDFANMIPPGPLELNGGTGNKFQPLPAGATSFTARWDTGPAIDTTHKYNITLAFWNASFSFFGVQSVADQMSGASGTFSGTIDPTWKYVNITVSAPTTSNYPAGNSAGVSLQVFCNGATASSPAVPCCPPDAVAMGLLQQVLGMLTLIQRQAVPFAYVPGDTFTALSGNGTIDLTGPSLAIQVELTTVPPSYGMAEGDPDALFDIGWITPGTADGFEKSRRIGHSPFLLRVTGDITVIGYSLAPGVVATIRSFLREP